MHFQKLFLLALGTSLVSYTEFSFARKPSNDRKEKCCSQLPQPPTFPQPYDNILEGENCVCCLEDRKLHFDTDLNANKICFTYEQLCASLCQPLNFPSVAVAPTYIPDPAIDVPPCQKFIFPPEVPNPLAIKGKNVLVIGGSKGLGKAIAERFASEGCNVIATSRHPQCYEKPVGYALQRVDVRYEDDVKTFINRVAKKCFNGKIDILVNCAAIYWAGPLAQATGDDLLNTLNNNIAGYQRTTHYALPYMRHNNETRVISFGSLAGAAVLYGLGGYGISKAAIEKWNDTLQIEEMYNKALGFEKFGPTFSCIEPGIVLTSIGLYEWFQASTLSPQDPLVQGPHQAFAGAQNTPVANDFPANAAEAAFRVAVAPQPGVRYTVVPVNDPINTLALARLSNTLSQDDAINLIWSPFAKANFDNLQASHNALGQIYCKGCSKAGNESLVENRLKDDFAKKMKELNVRATACCSKKDR